jgi:hypothetical protein
MKLEISKEEIAVTCDFSESCYFIVQDKAQGLIITT